MTREELKTELDRLGIDHSDFAINEDSPHGTYSIDILPIEKWAISFNQKKVRVGLCNFDSEAEACDALLDHLQRIMKVRQKYGFMTAVDLKLELDLEGINPIRYSLNGKDFPGDWYVLSHETNGQWSVFYTEKGLRIQECKFGSESRACEYLLSWLLFNRRQYPAMF